MWKKIVAMTGVFCDTAAKKTNCTKYAAPGEARTHNPGITFCTVYKYRALTDCATGAHWQKESLQGVGFEPTQSYDYESLNLTP